MAIFIYMKSLRQFIIESQDKSIELSFFDALMLKNVCDHFSSNNKFDGIIDMIMTKLKDWDWTKVMKRQKDFNNLTKLEGNEYAEYFCQFDYKYKLTGLNDSIIFQLVQMLDEFTKDALMKTKYGDKGITNVLELEGELQKL